MIHKIVNKMIHKMINLIIHDFLFWLFWGRGGEGEAFWETISIQLLK